MKVKFSLAVLVCLFLGSIVSAQTFLKVGETETKAFFIQNQLQVNLAIENTARNFSARIRLEILDAEDKIISQSETFKTIKNGKQVLQIPFDFPQKQVANNLLYYRLRYSIMSENGSTNGIVSLSETMPEIFELQVLVSDKVFAGMRLRAHILAVHPLTKKPIENVNITGEIALDLDVDRNSLEKAKADGKFSSYDILPDKIVVYLWSSSLSTNFNFKFRLRYGINAQNSPSIVYDYYNAEAQTTVAPTKFFVTN